MKENLRLLLFILFTLKIYEFDKNASKIIQTLKKRTLLFSRLITNN